MSSVSVFPTSYFWWLSTISLPLVERTSVSSSDSRYCLYIIGKYNGVWLSSHANPCIFENVYCDLLPKVWLYFLIKNGNQLSYMFWSLIKDASHKTQDANVIVQWEEVIYFLKEIKRNIEALSKPSFDRINFIISIVNDFFTLFINNVEHLSITWC